MMRLADDGADGRDGRPQIAEAGVAAPLKSSRSVEVKFSPRKPLTNTSPEPVRMSTVIVGG